MKVERTNDLLLQIYKNLLPFENDSFKSNILHNARALQKQYFIILFNQKGFFGSFSKI
jgi:hypothetical protein